MSSPRSVETLAYTTNQLHGFLDENAARPEGPNIGICGEHLTITFLSCNRIDLSLRLLRSIEEQIPNFAGEVLIFDNGSSVTTIEGLQHFIGSTDIRIRLIRSETNLGVACGRNRSVEEVSTSWVMSLDNDIIFLGDPMPVVQSEIAQLGCKFLSLPLLNPDRRTYFAFGGHLHMRMDEKNLLAVSGGGGLVVRELAPVRTPTLGTFLFGTACIFEAATFRTCGGFDESLFVGFEDTDFSIRLFRLGLKIGCSGASFLVHDHPKGSDADADYERTRFSRGHIEASARHMERKHGYSFWNTDLMEWLDAKLPDGRVAAAQKVRSKVALIVDVENWAFDNIAKQLCRHLEASFDFEIIAANNLNPGTLASLLQGFDLVHFFARGQLTAIRASAEAGLSHAGWPIAELMANVERRSVITVGVYDHLYLSKKDIERYSADPYWYVKHIERFKEMYNQIDGYYVSSKRLLDIYSGSSEYPSPECSLPDGVDLSLFRPDRTVRASEPLRVGWAGNSAWMGQEGDLDPKGLRKILHPAIDQLRGEGLSIELVTADRQVRLVPHKQMPSFYNSVDIFACCSESEGTPNPVLEAMACGIPVISTDVGIVPEAFGPLQKEFILARSVDAFAGALRTLAGDPERRARLGQENLSSIQEWDWSKRAADIGSFFISIMSRKERRVWNASSSEGASSR